MNWIALRIEPAGDPALTAAALFEAGAQGVQEDGTALLTHFPPDADMIYICGLVRASDPDAHVTISRSPPFDWSEAWKEQLHVHQLGALTVAPPWLAADLDPAHTIVVDPGMAFGTGEHPTTRGVLRLLQRVTGLRRVVADLGAGSAVLSIAAAKLGAERVTAIELDPDAIGNAEENVARNGVAGVVHVLEGDAEILLPLVGPVDLILANIVSSVLTPLLPTMAAALAPDGNAILSGILVEEREPMREVITRSGWRISDEDVEDVWWSVAIQLR